MTSLANAVASAKAVDQGVVAGPTPLRMVTISAIDLMAKSFADPKWAIRGLIPEGLTLLVGPPKKGKSWLCLNIAIAIAGGWTILERPAGEKGEVLYLALEDTERRLKQRLGKVLDGDGPPQGLHFTTEWPSIMDGGIALLDVWLTDHPDCRLVVVDTLARMRAGENSKGGIYQADYAAAVCFKQLADKHDVAFIVVHHVRKAEAEDPLDAVSGTNGLTGAADTTAVLRSLPGRADASFYIRGRDVEEADYALQFDRETCTWSMVGTTVQYMTTEGRAQILALLSVAPEPMAPREISQAIGGNPDSMRKTLSLMVKAGQLDRRDGKYWPVGKAASPASPASVDPKTGTSDRVEPASPASTLTPYPPKRVWQ